MFGFLKRKKVKYNLLPDKKVSYVTGPNGEPMLTYFRPNSGLFCSTPLSENDSPFFLNIRRPIVIDASNMGVICIPDDLPDECDGIIFLNYGIHKIKAYYVRNIKTQTMAAI